MDSIYTQPSGAGVSTAPMTNSATLAPTTGLAALFQNPNFLNLLGGTAAKLDPYGLGGALGSATVDYQRAKAAQGYTAAEALRNAPPTKAPLTPDGVAGPTSRTRTENADGTYSTTEKGDTPSKDNAPIVVPSAPVAPTVPIVPTTRLSRPSQMSDLPFLLAPQSEPSDMRGMTAEDAAKMFALHNEGEQLRQANIGQILKAYQSDELASHTGADDLATAQAKTVDVLRPGAVAAQERAAGMETATTANIKAKTSTEQYKLEQERSLGDLPKQLLEAQVQREKDTAGRYLQYTLPSGQVVKASVAEAMQMESGKATAATAAQHHQDALNHQAIQVKRWDVDDRQKLLETATKNEAAILGTNADGKPQAEDPRVIGNIDEYNASSNKPYIYHWEPRTNTGILSNPLTSAKGGATKFDIPRIAHEGKPVQLSAREVARLAASMTPPMEPKEYIEKVLTPRKVK